ncbi:MAG: glycosyltransferase family 4 protein [Corynebacterium sp.]|jgi:glycosyltransferase involved in cell wall biosynthesis|uniref:glycosyltransferase family 4 protein n=1 Tax=Corynebacterium sp. TaxID=1720 RepID=UPI003F0542BA
MTTILHVTDCFDGGVATAVNQYARLTPEYRHLLLANNARSTAPTAVCSPGAFAVDEQLPSSPASAVTAVRRAVADHRPDVVHAHSSFAGAYTRVARSLDLVTPGRPARPVVYTPHSFAFERADIPQWKRRAFRAMERSLHPLTTVGASCAQWEGELMVGLGRTPVVVVPNALMDDHPAVPGSWSPPQDVSRPVVGVVSRVTPQRDPAFFAETARLIRRQIPEARFVWVGAGDGKGTSLVDVLTAAGVEVTGWLSGEELRRQVAGLSLVLHTARWDGFPMAVLEARRVGVPLLVRDIPALRECPATARFDSPQDAAAKAVAILRDRRDPSHWAGLDESHTPERQHAALTEAYSLALEITGRRTYAQKLRRRA